MEKVNFKDYNSPFATRLRDLMEERKVKRIELAELLGVSRQSIGQYCDGTSLPPADKIVFMADYFDISTDYLLGRTDIKSSDVDIKQVCEITGLSEDVFEKLLFAKQRLISDPPLLSSYDCFLELIEEGYFTRICVFLANCILARKRCFSGIKDARDVIRRRIQEQTALSNEYDFSNDERFLELMDMELNSRHRIKFCDWELINEVQEVLNEYMESKEEGIIPSEATMNFDAFVKECVAHGKRNKEK